MIKPKHHLGGFAMVSISEATKLWMDKYGHLINNDMKKTIEEQMARFVELSMKFTVARKDIDMLDFLDDMINDTELHLTSSGVTLTNVSSNTVNWGIGCDEQEDTYAERRQKAIKTMTKLDDDYREYVNLRKYLSNYFKSLNELTSNEEEK